MNKSAAPSLPVGIRGNTRLKLLRSLLSKVRNGGYPLPIPRYAAGSSWTQDAADFLKQEKAQVLFKSLLEQRGVPFKRDNYGDLVRRQNRITEIYKKLSDGLRARNGGSVVGVDPVEIRRTRVLGELGITPEAVSKTASCSRVLEKQAIRLPGGRAASKAARRYLELVLGGNKSTLKDYNGWKQGIQALKMRVFSGVGDINTRAKLYGDLRGLGRAVNDVARRGSGEVAFSMPHAGPNTFRFFGTPEMAQELAKVRAARLGTAAGATVVGGTALAGTKQHPDTEADDTRL